MVMPPVASVMPNPLITSAPWRWKKRKTSAGRYPAADSPQAKLGPITWRAAARIGAPGVSAPSGWIGLAGAALFVISDSVLAIHLFAVEIPLEGLIVMVTYYAAQLGIAAAVARG